MTNKEFLAFVADKLGLERTFEDINNKRFVAHRKEWLLEIFHNPDCYVINLSLCRKYHFDTVAGFSPISLNKSNAEQIIDAFSSIIDCPWPYIFNDMVTFEYALRVFKKTPNKYAQIIQFCPWPEKMKELISKEGLWTSEIARIHENFIIAKQLL